MKLSLSLSPSLSVSLSLACIESCVFRNCVEQFTDYLIISYASPCLAPCLALNLRWARVELSLMKLQISSEINFRLHQRSENNNNENHKKTRYMNKFDLQFWHVQQIVVKCVCAANFGAQFSESWASPAAGFTWSWAPCGEWSPQQQMCVNCTNHDVGAVSSAGIYQIYIICISIYVLSIYSIWFNLK